MDSSQVVKQLAEFYNNNQFSEIYGLLSPEFKYQVSEKNITAFYKTNIKEAVGKVISWEYQTGAKDMEEYLVNFKSGKLILKLALTAKQQITWMSWEPVLERKEVVNPKDPQHILSTNPKQTRLQLIVDKLAIEYLKDPNNRSLSIGLIHSHKQEVFFYGEIKEGENTSPDAHSIYEIGSVTKTFTATLLAHAVLEHKIALDDDIRKYLPGSYPDLHFEGTVLTVLHLSNHTSGLPGLPDDLEELSGYEETDPYRHYHKESIDQYLKTFRPDTKPGSTAIYSNLGFALLGIILENIFQSPLETMIQQVITGPLNMPRTYFDVPENQQYLLTTGYDHETGEVAPYWQLNDFRAAGGLKSDLHDMMAYLKANILEQNEDISLTHRETDYEDGFTRGLGWVIQPVNTETVIWHNGGTAGFRSFCGFVPDKQTGVVVLSNSSADVDVLALQLLQFCLNMGL